MKINPEKIQKIVYNETLKALRNPMPRGAVCTTGRKKTPEGLNPIQIQDEYIANVSKVSPKSRGYSIVVSKAWRKAQNALLDLGYSQTMTDRMLADAHDVAQHERFLLEK